MDDTPIFRCGLEITGTERGEWQGKLLSDGGAAEFNSVLELLRLIQSEAGPPMPELRTK